MILAALVFAPLGAVIWWCLPESGAASLAVSVFILAMIGACGE